MQNLIKTSTRAVLAATGLVTIVACAPESGVGQFYREAGAQVETGQFGNATLHNQLVQTCRSNGAAGAGKAGAQARDPLVVLDPNSTPRRPVYRVHCNGQLDGKYGVFIYNEYVRSATQEPNVREANSE